MATAAVISFEETKQALAQTRARQQLHAHLDRWLDELEAHMPEDTPSLEELTQAVFARRQELTGKITEALVEQLHARLSSAPGVAPAVNGSCLRDRRLRARCTPWSARSPCLGPTSTAPTVSRASLP